MRGVLAVGPEVLTHAGLNVPEGRDRAAVERLDFSLLELAAEVAFALGLPPEAIDVAARPALDVPEVGLAVVAEAGFEAIENDGRGADVAVFVNQGPARGGHGLGAEDEIGGVGRAGQGGGRERVLRRTAGIVGAGRHIGRPGHPPGHRPFATVGRTRIGPRLPSCVLAAAR